MLKEFVEKIEGMVLPALYKVEDRQYTRLSLTALSPPMPDALELSTLTSFVDYIKTNKDSLKSENVLIHVENHSRVSLLSKLDSKWRDRESYVVASLKEHSEKFSFDRFHETEQFIIQLQSRFVRTETIAKILQIVGNMKSSKVMTSTDDGVTQSVEGKVGVAFVQQVALPNPVILKPYRTFLEIEQPESAFVLRVKQGHSETALPQCALFESDGGAWRMTAIKSIADYLRDRLDGFTVIA